MRYSFVIPVYGTEEYLPRCLDSIAAQTVRDYEVIIVDDCSPGECREIVARYDERFRYFRQDENRSSYQARNRAVREARGDYILAVDPDDYLLPGLLAELDAALSETPDVISYNLEMDEEGIVSPHWCRYSNCMCGREEVVSLMWERKMQWNLCGKAIRREIWLKTISRGGCDRVYINASDDYAAFLPIVQESRTFQFIDFAGYRYWQRATSTTHTPCSILRTLRSSLHTLRARRLALDYLARCHGDGNFRLCASVLARRIIRWSWHEFFARKKNRLSIAWKRGEL